MAWNTAFHTCLLEPELWKKEYIKSPKFSEYKKPKATKDWKEFVAKHEESGKKVLFHTDYEKIELKAKMVQNYKVIDGKKIKTKISR